MEKGVLPNTFFSHQTWLGHCKKGNYKTKSLINTNTKILRESNYLLKWPPGKIQVDYHRKPINAVHHINGIMEESYMITSIDKEKAFDKNLSSYMTKTLRKLKKTKTKKTYNQHFT